MADKLAANPWSKLAEQSKPVEQPKSNLPVEEKRSVLNWTQEQTAELKTEVEKNSWKSNLDTIFEWEKIPFLQEVRKYIDSYIDEKLKNVSVTPDQKNNIKVAAVDKIINNPDMKKVFAWFSDKIDITSKITSFLWIWDEEKRSEEDKNKESWLIKMLNLKWEDFKREVGDTILNSIIDDNLKLIIDLVNKNPKPVWLDKFLSNPKAIAEYKEGIDISKIQTLSQEELTKYLEWLKWDITNLNEKIALISAWWEIKEKILDIVFTFPLAKGIFDWILWSPIWDFIAKIFGYKTWNEMITWINFEANIRKSIKNLKSFWAKISENWTLIPNSTSKIDILKDKDLSWIDTEKLKPFFKYCNDKWADINDENFWKNVFENKKTSFKIKEKDPKDDAKEIEVVKEIQIPEIKDIHFDFSNKKPNDNFFNDLNNIENLEKQKQADVDKKNKEESQKTEQAKIEQQKLEFANRVKGNQKYIDLNSSFVINPVIWKLKNITLTDFDNWQYILKVKNSIKEESKQSEILWILQTYVELFSVKKVRDYLNTLTHPVTFETISYQRKNLLQKAGINIDTLKSEKQQFEQEQKTTNQPKTDLQNHPEVLNFDKVKTAIEKATTFPIALENWKKINYISNQTDLEWKLTIWSNNYIVKISNPAWSYIESIWVNGENFELKWKKWFLSKTESISKEKMSEMIILLLKDWIANIKNEKWELIWEIR